MQDDKTSIDELKNICDTLLEDLFNIIFQYIDKDYININNSLIEEKGNNGNSMNKYVLNNSKGKINEKFL